MPLPNFLIVGAAKSGTTALYHDLAQHPDVFLATPKEPWYLSRYRPSPRAVTTREAYEALFERAGGARRIGEATAGYLYDETAPERIRAELGEDLRLVAILRHPVDRAHSMYWHRRRDAEEPLSFEEALAAEPERIAAGWSLGWHYLAMGRYAEQLARYRRVFGRERILVLSFDEFRAHRAVALREVTDFLGLAPFATPPARVDENESYQIRSPGVERLLRRAGARGSRVVPAPLKRAAKAGVRLLNRKRAGYEPLDRELRRALLRGFEDDVRALAREWRPGFGAWLEEAREA